jgi:haloalkane dehalogenase
VTPCHEPDLPPATEIGDAEILYTDTCRPFVRTPDEQFAHLHGFPYEPRYATVDGMRMHYVEEGPPDGEVVLLLHGQPTWSYLYRKMIPVLAAAGLRVIAPDMIGMGRSDKPVQISDYRYLQHVAWVEELIDSLGLRDITVFVQDWGSLIGLRVVGNRPDQFARIVVANGQLPVVPEGFQPITLPATLDPDDDMVLPFTDPALRDDPWPVHFAKWAAYALVGTRFRPSEVVAHGSVRDLDDDELAAYDAPFPSRVYMAGVRSFPSLINTLGDVPTNARAREVLDGFERPVLTLFGRRDQGMGTDSVQSLFRDRCAGAAGQPHHAYDDAGHFIQEDKGEDLARRVAEFVATTRR